MAAPQKAMSVDEIMRKMQLVPKVLFDDLKIFKDPVSQADLSRLLDV